MKSRSSGILIRYLRSLYDKKFSLLAEHSYYATILQGEYPYVAEIFKSLVSRDMEGLSRLGGLLCTEGIDPAFDIRVHFRGCRGENIDRIITSELARLRREIDSVERIHALTDDPIICEAAEKMRMEISENIKVFERILHS